MTAVRILPCLDVRDGRIVKGVQFRTLRDAGDPVEAAIRYEADGADELVLLDVSATLESRSAAVDVVARIRAALSIPLVVGGGVRSLGDALALFDAGADKVAVNSAAVVRPNLLDAIAARVGRQSLVLAIDAAPSGDRFEVVVRAGREATGLDAASWALEGTRRGAGEVLLTSIAADGTRSGYDLPLVRAVASLVDVPVIASGGAGTPTDLVDAADAGADALLVAGILHDGTTSIASLKSALAGAGRRVRAC
jgi:imidazoleglycerol phosphate synthase cyclase subunit